MLFKNNKEKVLEIFFHSPTTVFHLRELARKAGVSTTTVMSSVRLLEKQGLVKKNHKGRLCFVKADRESHRFVRLKQVHNLLKIYESGMVDFLSDFYETPDAIIIFGSFAKGEDTEKSDIDIAVVSSIKKQCDLSKYEKKLGKAISLHVVRLKELEKEFVLNLANGIVLEGSIYEGI